MFDEYARTRKWLYCYGTALDGYFRYYDRRNIHIVLSEDMRRDPREMMDALQAFIGLPEDRRIRVDTLPRINEGTNVVKDSESAILRNKRLHEWTTDLNFTGDYALHQHESRDPGLIPYKEPMLPETRVWLTEFFMPEIRRVEEILDRSLQGLWY